MLFLTLQLKEKEGHTKFTEKSNEMHLTPNEVFNGKTVVFHQIRALRKQLVTLDRGQRTPDRFGVISAQFSTFHSPFPVSVSNEEIIYNDMGKMHHILG